ncbi:transposase, IS630 family [Escherichia coli H223]|nr:transposase, IS630 family [Escherichia coli H223]
MNKWLHRNGFTYKKPSGVPHKFSEEKQRQFIEYYKELKTTVGDEPILFIDGVHPTQATKISYGWIRKGQKKAVKTTGSRTRLNIMGALNLKALTSPLICEYKTINEYNVSRFFNEIRKVYPDYNQKNPRYSGWSRLPPFTVSERLGGSGKYQAALPSPLQPKPESDRKNVEINERTCPE